MKENKDHIGLNIKRLRILQNMTQQDLADKIQKTRSLISHLERTGNVNKYVLSEIAKALEVDIEAFEPSKVEMSNAEFRKRLLNPSQTVPAQKLIDQQQEEILFLKNTIAEQWKLLHELSKRK